MWKFWLMGLLVIGAAFAIDLANGVLHVYRGGFTVICAIMLVVTWRKSRAANGTSTTDKTA
ncbi:MAG: hypothetical protein KJO65_08280 [Gemmatimonadetes bacterium]|nr:hypothetical protein [Gemmatimonadota bacterium]